MTFMNCPIYLAKNVGIFCTVNTVTIYEKKSWNYQDPCGIRSVYYSVDSSSVDEFKLVASKVDFTNIRLWMTVKMQSIYIPFKGMEVWESM